MHYKHFINKTRRVHVHHKRLIIKTTRFHVHHTRLIIKTRRLHIPWKYYIIGHVHTCPILFENGDFFGHWKRYLFKNALQTEDFWKRWLLVYVWMDKSGSFRIRWCHTSFNTRITFPFFNVFYGRAKTIRIRYVWKRIGLKTEQNDLRFQKYPDTCGRGLCYGASTLICFKLTFRPSNLLQQKNRPFYSCVLSALAFE